MVDRDGRDAQMSARIKRVRELATQKRVLNDVTAAEFALTVETQNKEETIDYDGLIGRLEKSLHTLETSHTDGLESLIDRVKCTVADLVEARNRVPESIQGASSPPVPQEVLTTSAPKPKTNMVESKLGVFVRDDGTIDWDGAIASGKEVAKLGSELFERLNGKAESEGAPSIAELFGQVQEKEPVNAETIRLNAVLSQEKESMLMATDALKVLKTRLRDGRREGRNITAEDVQELRALDSRIKEQELKIRVVGLDLDMERICLTLETELGAAVEPNDQRLLVAEVALLDKQLSALFSNLKSRNEVDELVALVDPDELTLLFNQVVYLKTRLGIDSAAAREMDWGTLGKVAKESFAKLREGLSFYGQGTKLLVNDVQYAWSLLVKAASEGYVLKPR